MHVIHCYYIHTDIKKKKEEDEEERKKKKKKRKTFRLLSQSIHMLGMGAGQKHFFSGFFHVPRKMVMCFSLADTFQ